MNRRDFLAKVSVGLAAVALPFLPKPRKKLKAVWPAELSELEAEAFKNFAKPLERPVMMGFKGEKFLDAGYVYAPYRPLVFNMDYKYERSSIS